VKADAHSQNYELKDDYAIGNSRLWMNIAEYEKKSEIRPGREDNVLMIGNQGKKST